MIIESLHVKNFRSIYDENISCERLTALVGANGSGKSSFLHALRLFYSKSPKIDFEDFYNRNIDVEISIAITFKDLSDNAKTRFSTYLQNENLTVERVFYYREGNRLVNAYHGSTLQNPDFNKIKETIGIGDKGKTAQSHYYALKENLKYRVLPEWSRRLQDNIVNLEKWESDHSDDCVRIRDNGQFFGFTEVAQGYLGEFTQFLFIPAVKEATEEAYEIKRLRFVEINVFCCPEVYSKKKKK